MSLYDRMSHSDFENVVQYGVISKTGENVQCDRCKTTNITNFMHKDQHDLCLKCVKAIRDFMRLVNDEQNQPLTFMAQNYLTRMKQI